MPEIEPNYQPVSPDSTKACENCKFFEVDEDNEGMGKCFGQEVATGGTCDFFEAKEA